MSNSPHGFNAILSPCVGVCSLDDDGLCLGCRRSSLEIALWSRMSDAERLQVMALLPARDAAAG